MNRIHREYRKAEPTIQNRRGLTIETNEDGLIALKPDFVENGFKIEPTEDGFLFVLELTVSGIKALNPETENSILDKVEALTDDMGEEFDEYGLNLDDLEDFRIDLICE